jgi:hypothetical protein
VPAGGAPPLDLPMPGMGRPAVAAAGLLRDLGALTHLHVGHEDEAGRDDQREDGCVEVVGHTSSKVYPSLPHMPTIHECIAASFRILDGLDP